MSAVSPEVAVSRQVLRIDGVEKRYPLLSAVLRRRVGQVYAVRGVDMVIPAGRTVALVGESGCGKSTLARCVVGLEDIDGGTIDIGGGEGDELQAVGDLSRKQLARRVQIVFQDPMTSLSPRLTVGESVAEPMRVHGRVGGQPIEERVDKMLEAVGIPPAWRSRRPHELSGGQRQRVAVARALVLEPPLIVLDEPVSALDVSVQAQILNLLADLQEQFGTSYLLISHDLGVVRHLADEVAVMYLGRIVERGRPLEVLSAPAHHYTAALIASDPSGTDWDLARFEGADLDELPSASDPPPGCAFHPRCPAAGEGCDSVLPKEVRVGPDHFHACYYPLRHGAGADE
jgi:oligopeptide transport system ATP-binding protein